MLKVVGQSGSCQQGSGSQLGFSLSSSKECALSEQLQSIRKVLVELQIHVSNAQPSNTSLQEMQKCITAASEHAAKAKELSELIKASLHD